MCVYINMYTCIQLFMYDFLYLFIWFHDVVWVWTPIPFCNALLVKYGDLAACYRGCMVRLSGEGLLSLMLESFKSGTQAEFTWLKTVEASINHQNRRSPAHVCHVYPLSVALSGGASERG